MASSIKYSLLEQRKVLTDYKYFLFLQRKTCHKETHTKKSLRGLYHEGGCAVRRVTASALQQGKQKAKEGINGCEKELRLAVSPIVMGIDETIGESLPKGG
jgi:hypothetical protein